MLLKKHIFASIVLASLLLFSYRSYAETSNSAIPVNNNKIPHELAKSIRSAFYTHDKFIMNAVTNAAKKSNPQISSEIENYIEILKKEEDVDLVNLVKLDTDINVKADDIEVEKIASLAPAAGANNIKENKNWKGSFELGASFATGNTEEQNARFEGDFEYNFTDKISNITKFSTSTNKNNQVRTKEDYRINNKTRYNLSDKDYSFLELEYINDRFSGQDYRISELLGYGRELYKNDKIHLSAEVSLGARQTKVTGQAVDNNIVAKIGGDFDWKISQILNFGQNITISTSAVSTISKSSSFIKSDLTETLYLKFGVDLEHISDVPVGKENLDTVTKLTIGYDF